MKTQNVPSASPVDAIKRAGACAAAMRLPARWMARTATGYIVIMVGTLVIEMLIESFLGRKMDRTMPFLYELPLILPFLAMGFWWVAEGGRLHNAFQELKHIYTPGQSDARQVAPPSVIGPLLEATLAEATQLSVWQEKDIMSATALLSALLQSVRAEDKVDLTENQRKRLHEIVIPGNFYNTAGVAGKNTVVFGNLCDKLLPAAIMGLGVLGNVSSIPLLERFAARTKNSKMRASALHSVEQIHARLRFGPGQMPRADEEPKSLLDTS